MSKVSWFHRFPGVKGFTVSWSQRFHGFMVSWFHRFCGVNGFMVSKVSWCQWFHRFCGVRFRAVNGFISFVVSSVLQFYGFHGFIGFMGFPGFIGFVVSKVS